MRPGTGPKIPANRFLPSKKEEAEGAGQKREGKEEAHREADEKAEKKIHEKDSFLPFSGGIAGKALTAPRGSAFLSGFSARYENSAKKYARADFPRAAGLCGDFSRPFFRAFLVLLCVLFCPFIRSFSFRLDFPQIL